MPLEDRIASLVARVLEERRRADCGLTVDVESLLVLACDLADDVDELSGKLASLRTQRDDERADARDLREENKDLEDTNARLEKRIAELEKVPT